MAQESRAGGYALDEAYEGEDVAGGAEPAPAAPPAAPGDGTLAIEDRDEPVRPQGEKPGETAVEPGRSTPLLIYTANLHLAVFQVDSTQRKVIALAKAQGGFLARQDDRTVIVRVPARRFEATLNGVEGLGDVIHRQVQAQDVTEEFRDLTIRVRNLEAVRERLEALLARAEKVEDALAVQRELTRITGEIEQIKGRLRFIEDRVAFSTIAVHFQPRPRDDGGASAPPAFQLPFPWIHELGLRALLDVR